MWIVPNCCRDYVNLELFTLSLRQSWHVKFLMNYISNKLGSSIAKAVRPQGLTGVYMEE